MAFKANKKAKVRFRRKTERWHSEEAGEAKPNIFLQTTPFCSKSKCYPLESFAIEVII